MWKSRSQWDELSYGAVYNVGLAPGRVGQRRHAGPEKLFHSPWRDRPCLAATWRCRKNFNQWECSFHWKRCCHWLDFSQQRQIAAVRKTGPGLWHFSVNYRHHLGPRVGGIVGKTYQTYNFLPPCQEIDISRHKLNQNDNFVSKYPSSVATILKTCFRDHVTPIFQPTLMSDPGP